MAVELTINYRNSNNFSSPSEEKNTAEEAASGLQNVEKLIRLFSSQQQKKNNYISHEGKQKLAAAEAQNTDYADVAYVAVSMFRKVSRTRTDHARFRWAPEKASPDSSSSFPNSVLPHKTTEIPPAEAYKLPEVYCPTPIQQVPPPNYHGHLKETGTKIIYLSFLTRKPPVLSSSLFKRKCTSENGAFL